MIGLLNANPRRSSKANEDAISRHRPKSKSSAIKAKVWPPIVCAGSLKLGMLVPCAQRSKARPPTYTVCLVSMVPVWARLSLSILWLLHSIARPIGDCPWLCHNLATSRGFCKEISEWYPSTTAVSSYGRDNSTVNPSCFFPDGGNLVVSSRTGSSALKLARATNSVSLGY